MKLSIQELTKDISNIDIEDLLSCWQWRLADVKAVVMMSYLGDLFLLGNDDGVYWLQTDSGALTKVSDNIEHFQQMLTEDDKIDNWFLPSLIEKLIESGKPLKENEVYSYLKPPFLGGAYSVENLQPADISVHFAFTGQICEQIKDLPDGTKVNIKVNK